MTLTAYRCAGIGIGICRRLLLALLAGPLSAQATPATTPPSAQVDASGPRLRCDRERADVQLRLDTSPVADPYTVPAQAVGQSFRFKAVMVGDAQHIAYIKLYTYVYTPRQFVLVHQASYLAPAWPISTDVALTGTQRVYSHRTGGELRYDCRLLAPEPSSAPTATAEETR